MIKKRTPTPAQTNTLGRMIRSARKSRGLTQEKLAEAANCSPHWIHKIECGESNPTWVDAFRLVFLLGLDPAEILKEAGVNVPVLAG